MASDKDELRERIERDLKDEQRETMVALVDRYHLLDSRLHELAVSGFQGTPLTNSYIASLVVVGRLLIQMRQQGPNDLLKKEMADYGTDKPAEG